MLLQSLMDVRTNGGGVVSRRTFLRGMAVGAAGFGMLGWKDAMVLHAEELRKRGMACILLFMRGGPSQMETWDPKPGTSHGGPTQAIPTAVNGIQVADGWPNVAKAMNDVALVRSITNKEGEHVRATYQLHTGYAPSGSVKYPSFGSIVAGELGPKEFDLPHFVSIGAGAASVTSGFLGMSVSPFVVPNPNQLPNNVRLPGRLTTQRFSRRLDLLKDLEQDFAEAGGGSRVQDHQALYGGAARMVLSPGLKAFDLNQEKGAVRDRYGRNPFGRGCLLARRLVEQGVTFVEVGLGGWDTHQDNFNRVNKLAKTADPGMATLLADLKERGMLERTLVIWMGEFGRTPKINTNTGRDHFPKAFGVALAGGGIKGGQVIGSTSADGMAVTDRPVKVADLFCTFCQALKINPRKENISPGGRPIKIVDGGQVVKELLG
jgi:uncharacterized protein (DUF1501 family)